MSLGKRRYIALAFAAMLVAKFAGSAANGEPREFAHSTCSLIGPMQRLAQLIDTRWPCRWFLLGFLASACSAPGDGTLRDDASADSAVTHDTGPGDVIQDGSLDIAAEDTTIADRADGIAPPDAPKDNITLPDMSSDRAPDGPRDAQSVDAEAGLMSDGDLDAGDARACACQSAMSLDCFFDPGGPIASGPRPASDVGLADQICTGTFVPPNCIDNVEIFSYDGCNWTQIVVTGCYARTAYLFDTSNHQPVGASTAGDTSTHCRGAEFDAGWIGPVVTGGEVLSTSCQPSSCSLVCRLQGGVQMPTCVPGDAGHDVTGDGSSGRRSGRRARRAVNPRSQGPKLASQGAHPRVAIAFGDGAWRHSRR
jgi:hypothetical protein